MRILIPVAAALALTACGDQASLPITAGYGPNPTLVAPNKTLLPTVKVAKVERWTAGAAPTPAAGLAVARFADGLDHPRWLYTLPNGDVLVAESNAPERPEENKGIKAWVQKIIMGRAGATVPSANRITLLRDVDGDGRAEVKTVFLRGLNSPFGMVLVGGDLYVANTDAVVRFAYTPGATAITTPGAKLADLPAGPRNHHWTKNIIASPDGRTIYATVGSNSNVGENGMEEEVNRAAILAIDRATGATSLFAGGLRNPNGLAWNPASGALWTTVNERDEIGSDIVPDYMTSVKAGGFYGWPYSYYGQTVDARVEPARPDLVAKALRPDYALGPHTASLGLAFSNAAAALPASYASGVFVGQHGSWNRNPPSGYKVLFVPFAGAMPQGMPREVLTGFLGPDGQAFGRPVGVAIDKRGALLVADDVGNVIWRVTGAVQTAAR